LIESSDGAHLIAAVLAEFHTADNLLVDEIGGDSVRLGVVPRREDFLAEEQTPGGVPLHRSLLLGVLLALRDRVHHVVTAAT